MSGRQHLLGVAIVVLAAVMLTGAFVVGMVAIWVSGDVAARLGLTCMVLGCTGAILAPIAAFVATDL